MAGHQAPRPWDSPGKNTGVSCHFLLQYMNRELRDVQAGFRKGRGTRDQIANIRWIMERAREFQKNIYICIIDYDKAFDCVLLLLLNHFSRVQLCATP